MSIGWKNQNKIMQRNQKTVVFPISLRYIYNLYLLNKLVVGNDGRNHNASFGVGQDEH